MHTGIKNSAEGRQTGKALFDFCPTWLQPRWDRICALLLLLFVTLGCSFFTPYAAPSVLPPQPTPTPEICSENPPGLILRFVYGRKNTENQRVTLQGAGFIPGEKVTIRFEWQGKTQGDKIEATDYPVQADGTFSYLEDLPFDEPGMHWQVHVVHQRGTTCLSFWTQR